MMDRDEAKSMTDIAEEVERTTDGRTDMQPTGPDEPTRTDMDPTGREDAETDMQPTGPDGRRRTDMQPD